MYNQALARQLESEGHEVLVITEGKEAKTVAHQDGYLVDQITSTQGFRTDSTGYSYRLYKRIRHLTRTRRFDVIEFPDYQGEGYFSIKAKRLFGEFSGVTLWVHGHMSLELCDDLNEEYTSIYRHAIYNIERYAMEHADVATVPCQDLKTLYEERVPRTFQIKTHPIPRFSSDASSALRAGSRPTFLYVGRMEHRKGVDLLVKAAVRLMEGGQDFRVRLVGGDTWWHGISYRTTLLKMIPPPLQKSFEFAGPVGRDALVQEYQAATACVFPSRFENWPNVCLEAMSYGKPIIASSRGGMREMLDGGSGILIDPTHPGQLEAAMVRLLSEPDLGTQLGQKAKDRVLSYEQQPVFDYDAFLQGLEPPELLPLRFTGHEAPLVSVVVPCYNAANTIDQTVRNLLKLDYPHYEIVLVNDGSTDGLFVQKLDELSRESDRIRVFHKSNSGLPGARNYGVGVARGDFLVFCDADDLLHRNVLKEGVSILTQHQELAAVYPILRYFGDIHGVWGPQDLYLPTVLAENQAHAGVVIRRSVFEELGGYDESFIYGWEDWDFVIRLAKKGFRAEVMPREGYIYRVHPSSMVRTTSYDTRVLMYRHLWRKHEDLLGTSGAFVLDRELNLPSRGFEGEGHEMWLRERILRTAPARLVLFLARFIPRWIKKPIRATVKRFILKRVR